MEYKTRQWHEKCFVCCTCTNPIGTKSFIPKVTDDQARMSLSPLLLLSLSLSLLLSLTLCLGL